MTTKSPLLGQEPPADGPQPGGNHSGFKELLGKEFLPFSTLAYLHADAKILLVVKCLRIFGYSLLLLEVFITRLAFESNWFTIGVSAVFLLHAFLVIFLKARAVVFGYRNTLLLCSFMNTALALGCAYDTKCYLPLICTLFSTVSPSSNEIGATASIEVSYCLASVISKNNLMRFVSWYKLFGSFSAAIGCMTGGLLLFYLTSVGVTSQHCYQYIMVVYTAIQLLQTLLYLRLSSDAEPPLMQTPKQPPGLITAYQSLTKSKTILPLILHLFLTDSYASSYILLSLIACWLLTSINTSILTLSIILAAMLLLAGLSDACDDTICSILGLVQSTLLFQFPCNILTILLPFTTTPVLVIGVLLLRSSMAQFDTSIRNAYMQSAIVAEDRSSVNVIINTTRALAATVGPYFGLLFLQLNCKMQFAFVLAGVLKLLYDIILIYEFLGSS